MTSIVRTWEDEMISAEEIELTDAQLEAVYGASDDSSDDAIPADANDDGADDTSDPAVEGTSSVPAPDASLGCLHDLLVVKKKKKKVFFFTKEEECKKIHVG